MREWVGAHVEVEEALADEQRVLVVGLETKPGCQ